MEAQVEINSYFIIKEAFQPFKYKKTTIDFMESDKLMI
jgi:hypothetical protein